MSTTIHSLLCFDYGTQKIGVAAGQTITATASALPVLKAKNGDLNWEELDALVKQWKPGAFVVGMPFNMDGTENVMTGKAQAFAKRLEDKYSLPCYTMDERLTSREARNLSRENAEASGRKFNERAVIDSLSAQLILESWLAENC